MALYDFQQGFDIVLIHKRLQLFTALQRFLVFEFLLHQGLDLFLKTSRRFGTEQGVVGFKAGTFEHFSVQYHKTSSEQHVQ